MLIMGAAVLVLPGTVEAVVSARIAVKSEAGAKRLDRVSRVLFPAASAVVAYLAFLA